MVSHPVEIDDGGVELLLESWGGESAYFLRDGGQRREKEREPCRKRHSVFRAAPRNGRRLRRAERHNSSARLLPQGIVRSPRP